MEKFHDVCMVNRPCTCVNSVIVYSGIVDDNMTINSIGYFVDGSLNVTKVFGNNADMVCLDVICSRCGVSWVPFNPLFD